MDATDYRLAWVVYLVAGAVFAAVSWRAFWRFLPREATYLLGCLLLAFMFTPCAVVEGQPVIAPAVIVFLLDSLTIEPKAGIRALIPLVLALALALLVAVGLIVVHRVRLHRKTPATPQ